MKIFNKIIWVLLFAFSLLIVWINIQLHTDNFNKEERKADIILQLNFLKQEIKQKQFFLKDSYLPMPYMDYPGARWA